MRRWLTLGALVLGCSPAMAAGFVPTVIVRGGVAQASAAAPTTARDDADWRVSIDARWSLARAPGPTPELAVMPPLPPTGSRCASARLCAWERRARHRALVAIGRSR